MTLPRCSAPVHMAPLCRSVPISLKNAASFIESPPVRIFRECSLAVVPLSDARPPTDVRRPPPQEYEPQGSESVPDEVTVTLVVTNKLTEPLTDVQVTVTAKEEGQVPEQVRGQRVPLSTEEDAGTRMAGLCCCDE